MIIVTGGAGFIGSNIVKSLNERGLDNVLVVDDLRDGTKFKNLVDCEIADFLDKDDFLTQLKSGVEFATPVHAVFHQGACSKTTEVDGSFMMRNNYEYSKVLLQYCLERRIPFIYASSASVYGAGPVFQENCRFEAPLNVYGYSKFLFDQYVRRRMGQADSQVVGLRYFNVYGPREAHKGSMASVAYHLNTQLLAGEKLKLFEGFDEYGDGEQRRDFVFVGDAVAVNLWFLDHPDVSGIFNLGTGRSQSFNDMARAVMAWHQRGEIDYIPFPEHLRGQYQSLTEANLKALREAGYTDPFKSLDEGIPIYLAWLNG